MSATDPPVVHVTEQGPYRVEHPQALRLVRAGANHDSHGAPHAWGD